jgi:hypothetical protein
MPILSLSAVAALLALLGAHFYRSADVVPLAATLALLPLLFVRRRWAARTLQVALVLGALEWVRTLAALAAFRYASGLPFVRMVAILGAVAIVTGLAALLFRARSLRRRFGFDTASPQSPERATPLSAPAR